MPGESFSRLVSALGAVGSRVKVRGADHLEAVCPAHEDGRASLTADWHPGAGELPARVMLRCHAGCAAEDVVAAVGLGMADLYEGPPPRRSTPRARAMPPGGASKRARPATARDHEHRWATVTSYVYADADGVVVGEVVRQRCTHDGCTSKNFPVRRPATEADAPARVRRGWVYAWPTVRPLYRAPDVAAAVSRGGVVFVVEGEKDVETLAAVGVVGTCNPGGADNGSGSKWRAEHTAALVGASRVVVVADRDAAGYAHAAHVAGQVHAAGIPVGVVAAVVGKDVTDHVEAGHTLDELVEVDAATLGWSLPVAATSPGASPASASPAPAAVPPAGTVVEGPWGPRVEYADADELGGGGAGGGGGGAQVISLWSKFRVVGGQLCQMVRGEPVPVLNVDARLLARQVTDMADPASEPEVSHARLRVTSPDLPVPWETTVEWDVFRKGEWMQHAPEMVLHDDTSRGKALLYQGVLTVSGNLGHHVVYGCTGWRERDGAPVYVHAGGAIGAAGPVAGVSAADVELPRALSRYALPAPAANEDLRAMFESAVLGVASVQSAHVAAPAIALPFRAALGWLPSPAFPTGPKGQGKTGWLAYEAQFFAPSTRYNSTFPRPSFEHTSRPRLYALLYAAQHTLLCFDDGAPDRGPRAAQEWAAEFVRSQFNGSHRELSSRNGAEPKRTRERARGAGVLTAEQQTSNDSADSRSLFVPLEAEDNAVAGFMALDQDGGPLARAQVMAAYLAWVAKSGLYPRARDVFGAQLDTPGVEVCDEVRAFTAALATELMDELGAAGDGSNARLAGIVADWLAGAHYLLRFLAESGACTPEETGDLWVWLRAAMVELGTRQETATESRNPAGRLLRLLRSVLSSGDGHLVDQHGGTPADPHALGWEGTGLAQRSRGPRLGVRTDAGRVWLDPTAVAAAVNRAARNAGEPLELTAAQMAAQLDAAGYLRTAVEGGYKKRSTVHRVLGAVARVWDLSAGTLLGEDDDDGGPGTPPTLPPRPDDDPPPTEPTPPPASGLFVLPPHGDTPAGSLERSRPPGAFIRPARPRNVPPADLSKSAPESPAAPAAVREPAEDVPATRSPAAVGTLNAPVGAKFVAPAVVVDVDGGWLPDGTCLPLPADADTLAEVLAWAEGLQLGVEHTRPRSPDDGQVWLMPALAARLGLPDRAPDPVKDTGGDVAAELLRATRGQGWFLAGWRSWMRTYRRGGPTLAVAVVGWLPATEHPILAGDPTAAVLAARVGTWAATTGISWRLNGGVSAVDLVQVLPRRVRVDQGEAPTPPRPALVATLEDDYRWMRPATTEEAAAGYVHAYTATSTTLAAAAQVSVGLSAPVHVEDPAAALDLALPGYWRITAGTWDDRLLPDLLDPQGRGVRTMRSQWVTTPTLRRLQECGYAVDPLEAWVYPEHSRYLLPWSTRLRDAAATLTAAAGTDPTAAAVLAAVQDAATAGVELFGMAPQGRRRGRWWYRPDWRHHVVAEARSNLTRKLHAAAGAGWFPLVVAGSTVVYASDDPNPVTACPSAFTVGTGLGQLTPNGTAPTTAVLDLLATGPTNRPEPVLTALTAAPLTPTHFPRPLS